MARKLVVFLLVLGHAGMAAAEPDAQCTPACEGKECGWDGCGGSCGECVTGEDCTPEGQCVASACGQISFEGCCQSGTALTYCEDGQLVTVDCADGAWPPFCGWDPESEFYDCGVPGAASPDPEFPYACQQPCTAACAGKQCGPDGCGMLCGQCAAAQYCDESGQCVNSDCGDVTWQGCCSPDGMLSFCEGGKLLSLDCSEAGAGYCGWYEEQLYYDCATDGLADPSGQFPYPCVEPCAPACAGKQCGMDGCGGICGACAEGTYCDVDRTCKASQCGTIPEVGCCDEAGLLKFCDQGATVATVDCNELGVPSCGWAAAEGWYSCGTDGSADPSAAHPYSCTAGCQAACTGKTCGNDGCGGSCGQCAPGLVCSPEGICVQDQCGDVSAAGCCDGEVLKFCAGGLMKEFDCAAEATPHCGWSDVAAGYVCGTEGLPDPTGLSPRDCAGMLPPVQDVGSQSDVSGDKDAAAQDTGGAEGGGNGGGGCGIAKRSPAAGPVLLLVMLLASALLLRARRCMMFKSNPAVAGLLLAGALICWSCGADPAEEWEEEGYEQAQMAASTTHSIQLLQKGAFDKSMFYQPTKVLWGLVKNQGDAWESPKEVTIGYYVSTKLSKAVKLSVTKTKLQQGYFIAYKLKMNRAGLANGDSFVTTERFIKNPLNIKSGKMVVLPMGAASCYVGGFYDWEYDISVYDAAIEGCSQFAGKPISYFWGLTTISKQTYVQEGAANGYDFPWYDTAGGAVLDGWDDQFHFAHDGGYKGCYKNAEAIVFVPTGYKLLFKLKFAKYWETKLVETPDTKAFYVDPALTFPKCH